MTTSQEEQFEIARKAMEEEYRKNLEALERVKRFLPPEPTASKSNGAATAPRDPTPTADDTVEGQGQSLIQTVLEVVLSSPAMSYSPRMVLDILERRAFPFSVDPERRIISIGQALRKLTARDHPQVQLAREGSGRIPNFYRATRPGRTEDSGTVASSTRMTM